MIQVEAAGPNLPSHINVVPDRLISMAEYVFNNCIKNPDQRVGGFVTSDLSRLESYVTSVRANLNEPYRNYHSIHPPCSATLTKTDPYSPIHSLLHGHNDDFSARLALTWGL